MTTPSQSSSSQSASHVYLRAGGASVLLNTAHETLPSVLHWGADLGDLSPVELASIALTAQRPPVGASVDVPLELGLVPEASSGWLGTPGLLGHRDGASFSTRFLTTGITVEDLDQDPTISSRVRITAADEAVGLDLTIVLELAHSGLLKAQASVTNTGEGLYELQALDVALPVPNYTSEILDLAGRWSHERTEQRHAFTHGTHLRESRRAAGLDAALIMAAGTEGFTLRDGQVWGLHLGWSGNTRTYAERHFLNVSYLAAGELILPGEIRLAPGETYGAPWLYASSAVGLDAMARRFHSYLRSRPNHPHSPRPVTLNVWEAVYFDHRLPKLLELADAAAAAGVERYVLDDGWFGARRDDKAGLGDWYVSKDAWPDGLSPLVDHVKGLGMQFGLWFEPEMINEDSDLAREHPEWIMAPGERLPHTARSQQVLNLGIPECYAWIRDRMAELVERYGVDYIKWDHNRVLIESGNRTTGRAGVHEQTLAAYRLFAELKETFPGLEIESCSSGGGRADLGIMEIADRIWGSDCIDPLERLSIERGTSLLLPPEVVGSHVASPISHTTGRAHSLDFRAGNAFFSHFGIEWDLTSASPEELARLAEWVAAYKEHRALLHTGDVVHANQHDESLWVHGVVAADGSEAIMTIVRPTTGKTATPGRVTLPGLVADAIYRVTPLAPGDALGHRTGGQDLPWWNEGLTLSGHVLGTFGVQAPALNPEQLVLIHLVRED